LRPSIGLDEPGIDTGQRRILIGVGGSRVDMHGLPAALDGVLEVGTIRSREPAVGGPEVLERDGVAFGIRPASSNSQRLFIVKNGLLPAVRSGEVRELAARVGQVEMQTRAVVG